MKQRLGEFLYRHKGIEGLLYVFPFVALWTVFLAAPVGYGFYISLFNWNPMKGSKFVGFANYIDLFKEPRFWNAVANTFKFVAMVIPLIMGLGLLFALMVWGWGRTRKGMAFIQVALLLPYMLTVSIVSIIWRWLLDRDFGLVQRSLTTAFVEAPVLLSDPGWALPAIAFATAWWLVGYRMVVLQAGLGEIPAELFETAALDGARPRQQFIHIIIPLLKPALLFSLVLTIISGFRTFGQVLMMTEGGPGRATEVLAMYMYLTGFDYFNLGKAAAAGIVLLLMILGMTLVGIRLLGLKSELQ